MHFVDWLFIVVPVLIVIFVALRAQRYVHGVADFLSAGRVGGRYVVSVSVGMASMGLITLVGMTEMYYNSGFAIQFWSSIYLPVGFLMGLVGFCTYRFRETRAMTIGQFLEIRYSKSLRVTTAIIQTISGVVNYAIFPAVGARFLVYYLDLPINFEILGMTFSTFTCVMFVFLSFAVLIITLGGQVTAMVTDCIQGLLGYPMFLAILVFLFWKFSWNGEIAPVLANRAPGYSFLNPLEIENLRNFNLFYVFVGVTGMFLGRLTWCGTQGYNSSARSPHEAKMGNLLGTWRTAFTDLMCVIIGVVAFTFMMHQNFSQEAHSVRTELATKALEDVVGNEKFSEKRSEIAREFATLQPRENFSKSYESQEAYNAENADPFVAIADNALSLGNAEERKCAQIFRTIYGQMTVPLAMREILPTGLVGIFCALMIFLLISTDTTYMHSWGTIIVQDFVVPLRKKAFTPKQQIRALRISIAGVAAFAFVFSNTFAQVDFILMFFAITGAILAGTGAVITLGLYWSRGTTAGAFTSVISAAFISVGGIICQQLWASHIYPALEGAGLLPAVSSFFHGISSLTEPYIVWRVTPKEFPINSQEILFMANLISLLLYILVSLKTCKTPFNMERMLHRGIYSDRASIDTSKLVSCSFKKKCMTFLQAKVLGIDSGYTRGDKLIAWAAFLWSFVYVFGLCFCGALLLNHFSNWGTEGWSRFFFVTIFLGALILGSVFCVWFTWGGIRDLKALFRDLSQRSRENVLDDGRVENNQSVVDRN